MWQKWFLSVKLGIVNLLPQRHHVTKKYTCPSLGLLSIALSVSSAQAAIIIPSLNSSENLNSFSGPEQLINNSGLSSPVNNGDTLATAQAATHVFDSSFRQSWVTNNNSGDYFSTNPNPVFIWDLGQDFSLENVLLWQYQNNGGNSTNIGNNARLFELRYSTDADGPNFSGSAAFSGNLQSNLGLISPAQSPAQTFDLGGETARYIELTITDNYRGQPGITGGGDRVGLGEIRFDVNPVDPVPEPSTLLGTLFFGTLGASMLKRKKGVVE